jgi:hypothetical protein
VICGELFFTRKTIILIVNKKNIVTIVHKYIEIANTFLIHFLLVILLVKIINEKNLRTNIPTTY